MVHGSSLPGGGIWGDPVVCNGYWLSEGTEYAALVGGRCAA